MQNKPKLRFKEFNNEWNSTTFDKVFKTIQNNCFSRDLLNGTDKKCTKNVHYGDILIKYGTILDCDNITLPSIDSTVDLKKFNEESYLKDGDILIADTAEDYTVGKACEIVNVHDKVLSGLHTIPCRPLFDFASRFLGYYINSYSYHDSLIPLVTGIKVSSISKSSIAKTIVKYPSIDEQKKIAEFLSKVDEVISEREEEVKDLEQQKKGLMQKIFSQQLRFTDSNNNPYPDWEDKKIGDVFEFYNGKAHEQEIDENGEYIVVNSKFISTEGQVKKYTNKVICPLKKDDIVLVMSDVPNGKAMSKCYLIEEDNKYSLNQRICCLRTKDVARFFIYQISRNKYFLKFDNGVSQTNLRKEDVLKCPIQVPCLEEQQKIANVLSKLDELIEEKKALLSDWQQFKKGLLQQMFV